MTNVVPFNGITKLDLNPDIVLENTMGKLEGLVICGYDKDGFIVDFRREVTRVSA